MRKFTIELRLDFLRKRVLVERQNLIKTSSKQLINGLDYPKKWSKNQNLREFWVRIRPGLSLVNF